MSLSQALDIVRSQYEVITADETGATAERVVSDLLSSLSSEDADWLFDNWDLILFGVGA